MFKENKTYNVTMLVGSGKAQRKVTEKGTYLGKVNSHPEVVTYEFRREAKKAEQTATFAISEKLIHTVTEL